MKNTKATWLLAAALAGLLAPLAPVAGADPAPARTDFSTTESTGAFVLHVTNAAGLTFNGWVNYSYNFDKDLNFAVYTLLPNGTVWLEAARDASAPIATREGGTSYVGALGHTAGNPAADDGPDGRSSHFFTESWPTPEVWLVVAWIGVEETFSIEIDWNAGTRVEKVADGAMAFYAQNNLDQGARAHAGGTAYVNVADGMTHSPPNAQTFGVLTWAKYNLPARGRLMLDIGWRTHTVDYDRTTEWFGGRHDACFSWADGLHVFTTSDPVSLRFDYAGVTAGPDLFTLSLATFPPGTLPEPVWREASFPNPCDVL